MSDFYLGNGSKRPKLLDFGGKAVAEPSKLRKQSKVTKKGAKKK